MNVLDVGGILVNENGPSAYETPVNVNGPSVDGNRTIWTPDHCDLLRS